MAKASKNQGAAKSAPITPEDETNILGADDAESQVTPADDAIATPADVKPLVLARSAALTGGTRAARTPIGTAMTDATYPDAIDLATIQWADIENPWSESEKQTLIDNPHLIAIAD